MEEDKRCRIWMFPCIGLQEGIGCCNRRRARLIVFDDRQLQANLVAAEVDSIALRPADNVRYEQE